MVFIFFTSLFSVTCEASPLAQSWVGEEVLEVSRERRKKMKHSSRKRRRVSEQTGKL